MDGTISLPIFGHKSSSFFNDRLSVGSLKIIFCAFGAAVLLSFVFLIAYTFRALQPFEDNLVQVQNLHLAINNVTAERMQIEDYLATGEGFAIAEQAGLNLQSAIAQLASFSNNYAALSNLEEAGGAYLNLLRSYHSVALVDQASETRTQLREQISETENALDAGLTEIQRERFASASIQPLTSHLLQSALLIMLVLAVLFGIGYALIARITRHSSRVLREIREVTCQITEGNYNARLQMAGEADRDVVQLAQAFNQMADNLNLALQSETAATEQNRLQLLKLARQERMTAILEERQRIARELHDSVKQQLFSITLSAGAVLNLLPDAQPLVKTHLEHIKQAGHSAQSEMTILLQELVTVPLQDRRLEEALLDYLTPLSKSHNFKLVWRVEGTNTLTIAQEHALFRAVQEAVSNIIRHSEATVVRVSILYGLLTHIIVEDNGNGFEPDAITPTSNGLSMMRTRMKGVQGRIDVETAPGMGTRLTIQLDLRRR